MQFLELTSSSNLPKKDLSKYAQFVLKHPLGSIHQTYEWALFQSKTKGRERFRIFALKSAQNDLLATALIIQQELPLKKNWWYCPRGPLIQYKNKEILETFFKYIAQEAKKNGCVFLRFDPGLISGFHTLKEDSTSNQDISVTPEILENLRLVKAEKAHAYYQPEHTLMLDLSLSEEDLLKQMKPKGRYNIKVAQKHGVAVRISDGNVQDISAFYDLLQQTTTRDKFSGHSQQYYQKILEILGSDQAKLYLAEYQGKVVAGIIVTFFKDTAIYYFGASGNEHRNVMAPYLLQWQAILDSRKLGLQYYDFLGIAPENDASHAWAKVSDFKLKFGGIRVNYLPAQEIVYSRFWYFALLWAKKLRKIL